MRAALEAKLADMGCPGAIVGIFRNDGTSECYLLGVADFETQKPMQRDFHMRIGSVSKTFVGNLILQLVDEGKLALEDPISKYVEGVPNGDHITIRQLGNNTSGLYNSIDDSSFRSAIIEAPQREWHPREILEYAFKNGPYDEPGAGWHYSNSNAILLGLAIEKIEGAPLATVMQKRICEPLGLKGVGFSEKGTPPDPFPTAYRNGGWFRWLSYGSTQYEVTNYSASWSGAAGNMYATVDDLGKAMKSMAAGEQLGDAGRRALVDWTITDSAESKYGFCLTEVEGWRGHVGDVPGYQAVARWHPEMETTIVVLTNLSNNKDRTMPAEELEKIARAAVTKSVDAAEKP